MIRTLWDRLTGSEAERVRAECERERRNDRDNHERQIALLRLKAAEHGLLLYSEVGSWVDVSTFDGEHWIPGTREWAARPLREDEATTAQQVILDGMP